MAVSNRDVRLVQVAYPQIYFACHTRHIRRASTATRLSAPIRRSSRISMKSALTRPTALREASRASRPPRCRRRSRGSRSSATCAHGKAASDGRAVDLRLTAKGAAAMQASSVLDSALVAKMLDRLSSSERKRALEGIGLLAKGARWRPPPPRLRRTSREIENEVDPVDDPVARCVVGVIALIGYFLPVAS